MIRHCYGPKCPVSAKAPSSMMLLVLAFSITKCGSYLIYLLSRNCLQYYYVHLYMSQGRGLIHSRTVSTLSAYAVRAGWHRSELFASFNRSSDPLGTAIRQSLLTLLPKRPLSQIDAYTFKNFFSLVLQIFL